MIIIRAYQIVVFRFPTPYFGWVPKSTGQCQGRIFNVYAIQMFAGATLARASRESDDFPFGGLGMGIMYNSSTVAGGSFG